MPPVPPGSALFPLAAAPLAAASADGANPWAANPWWAVPFAGLLLSIALFPMFLPRLWHRRMGLVALGWALALLLPLAVAAGPLEAAREAWHALLAEYLPFVSVLLALFAAGGGILIQGGPWGAPVGNTLLLALGTLLAGVMGTTGVSMVLIHPLLRANAHRARKAHLVVFFILLVSNAGGATTPLGDPPLYLGFLRGVPFSWPVAFLSGPLLALALPLLLAFFLYDRHLARREPVAPPIRPLRLRGWPNVVLIGVVIATVLAQSAWRPGDVVVLGEPIGIERLAGVAVFFLVAAASVAVTPLAVRQGNMFAWAPIVEVAKLVAAVFVTIGPVMAMLEAGQAGPMAGLLRLTTDGSGRPVPLAFFLLTGALSAFLDNAPTFLVFFETAGGDVSQLTGPLADVLRAISAGAVFFGALTYIGNAPNLMVRSIAAHRGVRLPGFFGYLGIAASLMAVPLLLVCLIFFRPGAVP